MLATVNIPPRSLVNDCCVELVGLLSIVTVCNEIIFYSCLCVYIGAISDLENS